MTMHAHLVTRLRNRLMPALLAGAALLAGCATGPQANPRDPLEPWNRGVYQFNDAVDRAVLKPAATAYTTVTPGFVQTGVRNFFSNLGDAWSTVNSALQFKGQETMNSFWRFTINSTFGLGGIFDVASEARIPQKKQDFGMTLGHWGVASGPYLVLPLLGPSTVRDTVALPVDMAGNPLGGINDVPVRNSLVGLGVVNQRAQLLDAGNLLNQAALDPYSFMRDAYLQNRESQIQSGKASAAQAGAAAAPAQGGDGYEPPPDDAGAAPPPAPAGDSAGYEPPPESEAPAPAAGAVQSPVSAAPRQPPAGGAQNPYYVPAVPQMLDKVSPGFGGSFWKR